MSRVSHENVHCAFIPPFILEAIAQSQAVSSEERSLVQQNLEVATQNIRDTSTAFYGTEEDTLYTENVGIVPPHITRGIVESDSVSEQARVSAAATLRDQELRTSESTPQQSLVGDVQVKSKRQVYDMKNTTDRSLLPGEFAFDGQPSATSMPQKAVDDVYKNLGIVYDFFAKIFKRDSIDGKGMPLIASVHYGKKLGNAFWNGRQMLFGDGDDELLYNFVRSIDVIAHELFHGITQYTANLSYQFQSSALNESVSDVFGSILHQYVFKQPINEADWLLGDDCLLPTVKGTALRSLKAPGTAYNDPKFGGKDPQPAHMKEFRDFPVDHDKGGVHYNSGIPNHAFYLAAMAIGGYSWEKPAQIWFQTLTDAKMHRDCDFRLFAEITIRVAKSLYGADIADKVQGAWNAVGVSFPKL